MFCESLCDLKQNCGVVFSFILCITYRNTVQARNLKLLIPNVKIRAPFTFDNTLCNHENHCFSFSRCYLQCCTKQDVMFIHTPHERFIWIKIQVHYSILSVTHMNWHTKKYRCFSIAIVTEIILNCSCTEERPVSMPAALSVLNCFIDLTVMRVLRQWKQRCNGEQQEQHLTKQPAAKQCSNCQNAWQPAETIPST